MDNLEKNKEVEVMNVQKLMSNELYVEVRDKVADVELVDSGDPTSRVFKAEQWNEIQKLPHILVRSIGEDTDGQRTYAIYLDIDNSVIRCSCPDHQYRGTKCKHLRGVELNPTVLQALEDVIRNHIPQDTPFPISKRLGIPYLKLGNTIYYPNYLSELENYDLTLYKRLIESSSKPVNILLEGPAGSGKSQSVQVFAKWKGIQLERIDASPDMDIDAIFFKIDLQTGKTIPTQLTKWLWKLYKNPEETGILLIDEFFLLPQSARLFGFLNGDGYSSEFGFVPRPKNLIIFATTNPLSYTGTQRINEALLNRFSVQITYTYNEKAEKALLKTVLTREEAETLHTAIRNFRQNSSDFVISMRNILQFIKLIRNGFKKEIALRLTMRPIAEALLD